jgi:hypothetical protein
VQRTFSSSSFIQYPEASWVTAKLSVRLN